MPFYLAKIILFGACPLAIVIGGWVLSDYSYRPGPQSSPATDLHCVEHVPACLTDAANADSVTATVILFFHPHCPCTNATLRNLERFVSRFSGQPRIVAFGFCPAEKPESWISSALTSGLRQLNANVIVDKSGNYCSQFGVSTSGHVLVYDGQRQLMFSGGITPGRGHEGDCLAATDLINKVNGHLSELSHWPVYGCQISNMEDQQP